MNRAETDLPHMLRACELAARARGYAEPNPTVGCVIAVGDRVLAEGWTQTYGGDHAEVQALKQVPQLDKSLLPGATLYVTLEPCCHQGKTAPCTEAILRAGLGRVVVAMEDPFPKVAGEGVRRLRSAGLEVVVGVAESEARAIVLPYLKLLSQQRPWVIGKWAMTLDGKIATVTGDSRWISSPASREIVHQLRGRADAILVGIGTVLADNPMLTARPAGPRVATRIVLDSSARMPLESKLVQSARETSLLIAVSGTATDDAIDQLQNRGAEVVRLEGATYQSRLESLLDELGSRRLTNVLVEGGGTLLGCLFDSKLLDEIHVFVAPKIVGGQALSPVEGNGVGEMADARQLKGVQCQHIQNDLYISGRFVE